MKKLDWYILQKFIGTFFFSIFLFAVIAVVIDVSEKTDDFVKSHLGIMRIITDYYAGFVPHIIALLFPLFVFIAVIFFTSKMAGQSEIVAILASGISFNRWLRPYYVGGIFLGVVLWFSNHYIVPNANKIRGAFESVYIDGNSSYENLVKSRNNTNGTLYVTLDSFRTAGLLNYDSFSKRAGPFFMNEFRNHKMVKNTRADAIEWDKKKNQWQLINATERTIDGLHEPIVTYPTKYMQFDFKPADLTRDKYTKDKLTSPELQRLVAVEERHGAENLSELKVEIGRRDATPVTVFLLTIIGAVVSGKKVRGGSGSHLAIGFITAAAFIIAQQFSSVFATKGNLSPTFAAWIPNILFSIIAIILYRQAPK